jgi:crotonobetainyl-CoA:carnitine CoA-transferase CaiB-like acyl-CoA transferase
MSEDLLTGILIIDLSEGVAASYCGRLLAGYCAEVIKVERPGTGDLNTSWDTGKKTVTLDYTQPAGVALLRRLVEGADALIEDRPPDYLGSLGLGYQEMNAANPRLIVTSVTPNGSRNPYEEYQIALNALAATLIGLLSAAGIEQGQHVEVLGSECLAAANSLPGITPSIPAEMTAPAAKPDRGPQPGEHNEEVYHGMLGLTQEELSALREAGII